MPSNPQSRPAASSKAIAQRLRAHARLCEQIARECWNELTAEKLKRMACDCSRVAAEIAAERDTPPHIRH
jgi:hypothetical protein